MEMAEISAQALAKRLASCKQSARSRAVHLFCSWLPNQSFGPCAESLSDSELIKLWKGLFFCVWHSDKLPNQVKLINRLSILLSSLCPQLACLYLEAFLVTIRREWSGIDFLRLDKFYLLIRRFLRHVFVFLKNNSWNPDLTSRIIGILSKESLLSGDKFPSAGVNYHIAEIFLDEIAQFLPLSKEVLHIMLNPFISVIQTTTDKVLMNKIKISIFDRLAASASNLISKGDADGDVDNFGKIALSMGFSKLFFELASADDIQHVNRKFLFTLYDLYHKLDKEIEKSSFDISSVQLNDNCSVESVGHIEASNFPTIGNSNDIKEVSKIDSIKKKKMKKNKGKKALDETLVDSKTKKRNKNSLDSSIGNNDFGSEKMNKSTKHKKEVADMFPQGSDADSTIRDSRILDNSKNCDLHSSEISFDDSLLSNLQKQFEQVAADSGMTTCSNAKVPKKRKREKNTDYKLIYTSTEDANGGSETGKSAKKVRFSMKKNLIWKPQNPLPPQSLRLPPSVTPRGSALKKGLPPGPIRESQSTGKKMNMRGSTSSTKKARKILIAASPVVKHLRLFHGLSA